MMPRYEAYQETVRRVFADLKRIAGLDQLAKRRIALAPPVQGCLVPVCEVHATDAALIATLADWRKMNNWAYPTQFEVTTEGTRTWLRSRVLDAPGRIMFLVESLGTPIGHVGLADALDAAREMKIDNVMRGQWDGQPGIMSVALRSMLDWAERTLAPRRFYLPVFTDNVHAISFYHKFGFRYDRLVPLRRREEGGRICYERLAEADRMPPDRHHLIMTMTPSNRTWCAVLRDWWANSLPGNKGSRADSRQTAAGKVGRA